MDRIRDEEIGHLRWRWFGDREFKVDVGDGVAGQENNMEAAEKRISFFIIIIIHIVIVKKQIEQQ